MILGLWVAGDAARELRDDVLLAARRAGMNDKAIASSLDVGKGQLSDQLALRAHLSLWRMAALPREFWSQFLSIRAERYGFRMLAADAIAQLVLDVQAILETRRKRMAKVDAIATEERKRA